MELITEDEEIHPEDEHYMRKFGFLLDEIPNNNDKEI